MGTKSGPRPGLRLKALFGQHNMQAFSCETGVARMPGACRHWFVAGTVALLLCAFGSAAGHAQDPKLLANCGAPVPAQGSPDSSSSSATTTVSCELRVVDSAAIKSAKATIRGRTEALESSYTPFDAQTRSLAALLLIQNSESAGRDNSVLLMADAVSKIADGRDAKRRFAAYTFDNELKLVADFNASKPDFDKQVRAIRSVSQPSQLYRAAFEAIAKLAKEPADR